MKRGFTLIELLVVVGIIGLLASVIVASTQSARMRSRDAKRMSDFKAVSTAMQLYYDKYNAYPPNLGGCCTAQNHSDSFRTMVATLVTEGFIPNVPSDPSDPTGYRYYRYGPGPGAGALLVTYLETVDSTTVGPYNSCRPFTANWCSSTVPSKAYCICHHY